MTTPRTVPALRPYSNGANAGGARPSPFQQADPLERDLRSEDDLSFARVIRAVLRHRRLMLGAILAGLAVAALAGTLLPGRSVGEAVVQLVFENAGLPASGATGGGASIVLDAAALVRGETEIIASRAVARRVLAAEPAAARFAAARAGRDPIQTLQKALEVANDGKSYIVRIRFTAGDARTAATIANAFADAYRATRAEQEAGAKDERVTQIAAQIAQAEREADEAGRALQSFAEQTALSLPAAGAVSATDQQLRDLLAQLAVRQGVRREKELRVERLRQAAERGTVPLAGDLDGAGEAQRLVDAELTARRDLALLRTSLGPLHPRYEKAQAALKALETDRARAVTDALALAQSDLLSTQIGERSLLSDITRMQGLAVGEGPGHQEALRLQARWQSAVASLDQLRAQLQQTRAAGRSGPVGAVVVSPAEALERSLPQRLVTALLIGLFGGAASGLALVYAREARDTGYAEVAPAERGLGMACVGLLPGRAHSAIPKERELRDIALRGLITRFGLSDTAAGRRFIVFGAALPDEVATGLVRELALILTEAGRRVVLVEPTATPAGAAAAPADAPPKGMIATTIARTVGEEAAEAEADGHVVPSFEEPAQLLDWLDTNAGPCDVVLVQAPAILTDPRAAILARAADVFVLTLAWHRTPRAALALAVRQLAALPRPAAALAFVFTQVDLKRHDAFGPRDSLYFQNRLLSRRARGSARAMAGDCV